MGILEDIAKDMEAKIAKEPKIEVTNTGEELGESLTKEELYEATHNPKPLTREQQIEADKQDRQQLAEYHLSDEYKAFAIDKTPVVYARKVNDGNLPPEIAKEKKTWKHTDTSGVSYFYRGKRWYENQVLDSRFTQEDIDKVHRYGFKEIIKAIHKKFTKSHIGKLKLDEVQLYIENWTDGKIGL